MSTAATWGSKYVEKLGMVLTWTPPPWTGAKGPRHPGWNLLEHAITTPAAARRHWSENPAHGIACLLEPSHLVSLDVDDEERSRLVLEHCGVDLDELRGAAPCIVGRHFRLMYRAPDVPLKHRTLAWPRRENPTSSTVLLELRAGAIADTLAPTLHVGTGKPYRWANPPRDGVFPPLPDRLLALWQDWTETSRAALALCPWAPAPKEMTPARRRSSSRESVIDQFNAAHDVTAILTAHGYKPRGKRFSSPDCQHAAGVVVLESGRVYCHNQGDPLSGEHAHDSFDVYRLLEHHGDYRSAVAAAAQALGLNQGAP